MIGINTFDYLKVRTTSYRDRPDYVIKDAGNSMQRFLGLKYCEHRLK